MLRDKMTEHLLMRSTPDDIPSMSSKRYSSHRFFGILVDTGAAEISTANYDQFLALQRLQPSLKLDTSGVENSTIKIAGDITTFRGSCTLNLPIGTVKFYVTVDSDTPFLLGLRDLDRLHSYYNNLTDHLVQCTDASSKTIKATHPVHRRFGHAFLPLGQHSIEEALISSYKRPYEKDDNKFDIIQSHLTEPQLRQLHRRFGHPSAARLAQLLSRSGHEHNRGLIDRLTVLRLLSKPRQITRQIQNDNQR